MTEERQIKVLDYGYVKLVETWGSDERIIEAARMSTGGGFKGWGPVCKNCKRPIDVSDDLNTDQALVDRQGFWCTHCDNYEGTKQGDEKLLRYLYENKHATPFEMAGMVIEVKAPIFIYRQWHRHRTQCLAPDTLVHFESPNRGARESRRVYKLTMQQLWERWQPTVRKDRPERQSNALQKWERVQGMLLRCFDEEAGEFVTTKILDVIKGAPKPMVRVTTASGRTITATREHRFLTNAGWQSLGTAIDDGLSLTLEGTRRGRDMRWEVPPVVPERETWAPVPGGWAYEVSSAGRVRRVNCDPKKPTVGAQGYDVVSLSRGGKSYARTVHRLVLEAFRGERPRGQEARHLNGNRADNRLSNLAWGTPKENAADRITHDSQQRLGPVFEEIVSVENAGEQPTFDLSVKEPWHNFSAEGFVVHNSYNEMSARYTPLPAEDYLPPVDRLVVTDSKNKQAGKAKGARELTESTATHLQEMMKQHFEVTESLYQTMLAAGTPKELARLVLPVSRYSVMRASANLRNWLAFMTLRCDPHAQQEIRDYANVVATMIGEAFPRAYGLWLEGKS